MPTISFKTKLFILGLVFGLIFVLLFGAFKSTSKTLTEAKSHREAVLGAMLEE